MPEVSNSSDTQHWKKKQTHCRTTTIKSKICIFGLVLCFCAVMVVISSSDVLRVCIYADTYGPFLEHVCPDLVYSVIQLAACHVFMCSLSMRRLDGTKTSSEVFSTSPFSHSLLPVSSLAHDKTLGGCLQPIMFSVEQLNCFITATLKALES